MEAGVNFMRIEVHTRNTGNLSHGFLLLRLFPSRVQLLLGSGRRVKGINLIYGVKLLSLRDYLRIKSALAFSSSSSFIITSHHFNLYRFPLKNASFHDFN